MNYTENQTKAIKHFNNLILDCGDMTSACFEMSYLMEALTENGWTTKQAEGTIGSLVENGTIVLDVNCGVQEWWIYLDKNVA